jgi:hypothetical protein
LPRPKKIIFDSPRMGGYPLVANEQLCTCEEQRPLVTAIVNTTVTQGRRASL